MQIHLLKKELSFLIINIIQKEHLKYQHIFDDYYKKYEEIEFIYNLIMQPVCIKYLYNEENELQLEESNEKYNITTNFYEGFGFFIK